MDIDESFELPEGYVALAWRSDGTYMPALNHAGHLIVFAIKENAEHAAARVDEEDDDLRGEVAEATEEQIKEAKELVPAREETTFEAETEWQEDARHARYVAGEFLRRLKR